MTIWLSKQNAIHSSVYMTQRISTIPQTSLAKPSLGGIVALILAIVSIAASAIFMRVVEQDITPWATAFHRFWLTAVIVGLWNGIKLLQEHLVPTANPSEESEQSWDMWIWGGRQRGCSWPSIWCCGPGH
jgi:hypothetical protein